MTIMSPDEPFRLHPEVEATQNDGDGAEGQRAAKARRRQPSLVDDPRLAVTLEEVDLALDATSPESYLAPPPLTDRLVVPLSYGRWSPIVHAKSAPSFGADPISEEKLSDIDGEFTDGPAESDSLAIPPPLMARLPGPTHLSARRTRTRLSPPGNSSSTLSEWTVSVTLILLMFAGAAAGAVVFHERLSAIVLRWDLRLK